MPPWRNKYFSMQQYQLKLKKKLNKIHYKNEENWLEPGVFLFFSYVKPHIVFTLFLYFCFKFRLSYSICQKKFYQLLKLHLTSSFDIYLLITVHFCFPNLDKKIFVLISALTVLILFLFPSKSHCSFEIFLIKKSLWFVIFYQYLCFFLVPSFNLYLLDYWG